MERREFLALAVTLPLAISDGGRSGIRLNYIRFIGSFGRQVEQELRAQLPNHCYLVGHLLNLNTQGQKPNPIVVAEIGDPELLEFIKHMKSSIDIRHSCVGYFALNFQSGNTSIKENIASLYRLIYNAFPRHRIFTDLDYQDTNMLPRWPLKWETDVLTTEQKQIVWELRQNLFPHSLKSNALHPIGGTKRPHVKL